MASSNGNEHTGHRKRLKKKFIENGLDVFEPHQALELYLFYAIPRKDTNPIAHELMKKYGSLSAVFEADPDDIQKTTGIGRNSALLLSLIPSLSRRYFKDRWGKKPLLSNSRDAGEYAVSLMAGRTYEVFYLICLDTRNRVIYPALVHKGTLNEAPVYPRIIVETALRHKAGAVILAHNHPGGSTHPSSADIKVTKNVIAALTPVQIRVLDHIIVAGDCYLSMAQEGLIESN